MCTGFGVQACLSGRACVFAQFATTMTILSHPCSIIEQVKLDIGLYEEAIVGCDEGGPLGDVRMEVESTTGSQMLPRRAGREGEEERDDEYGPELLHILSPSYIVLTSIW